jgi:MoxR-like ATPase
MERSQAQMAGEMTGPLRYTGTKQPAIGAVGPDGRRLYPYIPPHELVEAANLAMFLERPLLIRGEPGCGKSLFASAIAYELGLPLTVWNIRSTTRAADGLYTYDAIARLRDAQITAASANALASSRRSSTANDLSVERYIRLGPVGRAFAAETRGVLLIDEIDKADIDFPNDILDIMEYPRFTIEEADQTVTAKHAPIIIITSNDEKELPEAFLRRCLFAYVPFPDSERLVAIIQAHFGNAPTKLVTHVIRRFEELRRRQEQDSYGGVKKVSTSELIDWMRVLLRDPERGAEALSSGRPYPHRSVLIKRHEDSEFAETPMEDDELKQ